MQLIAKISLRRYSTLLALILAGEVIFSLPSHLPFFAVYALRGIYFSLIEEAKLDKRITGSAVGLISVLGFTPDIFFGAVTGRILDANPGAVGFQHYFLLMAVICAAGMVCTVTLSRRLVGRNNGA